MGRLGEMFGAKPAPELDSRIQGLAREYANGLYAWWGLRGPFPKFDLPPWLDGRHRASRQKRKQLCAVTRHIISEESGVDIIVRCRKKGSVYQIVINPLYCTRRLP